MIGVLVPILRLLPFPHVSFSLAHPYTEGSRLRVP